MSVHAPGLVHLGRVDRATGGARAIARAFPSAPSKGNGRRSVIAGLSMTSMIDVLVVMTVFLLLTFSADSPDTSKLGFVPPATNVSELLDAPLVTIGADAVMLDGAMVVSPAEMAEHAARSRVQRFDALGAALLQKRERSKLAAPGKEPPSHVVLAIGSDVKASVVKSVVTTAARSGYPSIDFMVRDARHGG